MPATHGNPFIHQMMDKGKMPEESTHQIDLRAAHKVVLLLPMDELAKMLQLDEE